MTKKYFWLKLKHDFFQDKKIKKLRKIAGGDTFTIIYLKMQLLSLKEDGFIKFDDLTSEFYEEIALELDEDEENVRVTLNYLLSVGLIEEVDNKSIAMIETIDNIGRESESASRVRKLREKQKLALQSNVTDVTDDVTDVTCNTELELESELELELELESYNKTVHQDELESQFEQFWTIYPKKLQKKDAKNKFKIAIKKYDFPTIMKGTYKFNEYHRIKGTSIEYIPQPTTFFNQERYMDDYDALMTQHQQSSNTNKIFNPWEVNDGRESNQTNLFDNSRSIPSSVKTIGFGDVL